MAWQKLDVPQAALKQARRVWNVGNMGAGFLACLLAGLHENAAVNPSLGRMPGMGELPHTFAVFSALAVSLSGVRYGGV